MSTQTTNLGLVKPDGPDRALVAVLNENMNKIDQYAGEVNDSLGAVEDGMAIVADGNTHAAITSGQFVYVRNHSTLTQGLYTATANIAANATLSTSNLTADPSGGLNALNSNIATLFSRRYFKQLDWGQKNLSHTITFSGKARTRILYGFVCVVGQSVMSEFIPFFFTGNGGAAPANIDGVILAANSSGITVSGTTIEIPAAIGGSWGFVSLILLFDESTLTIAHTES